MAGIATASPDIDQRLVAAHRMLRADSHIQFDAATVAPPTPAPAWLKALGRWVDHYLLQPIGKALNWIGSFLPDAPYARIILWTLLVAGVVLILWVIVQRLREGVWSRPRWRRRILATRAADETGEAFFEGPVRTWLAEADALAGEGRFAEALHHLLLKSVDDIARRRPQMVRPSLTSREIARTGDFPYRARTIFSRLAAGVERSLFGGRAVDADEWTACRAAYADFAQGKAWGR
jgi:hypothetical protein